MEAITQQQTHEIVDHFFRHESGKITAHLTRIFGTHHLELVEDCVQDALVKAMQVWPYAEVPKNPSGWILQVARNKMLDTLRRQTNFDQKKTDIKAGSTESYEHKAVVLDTELEDDQLRMMFACCHPILSVEQQIIITLKILGGFSTGEIARALLKKDETVAKAYTRAKTKMKEHQIKPEVPTGNDLKKRLTAILHILYLMFNEGYSSTSGDNLVRKDLCFEAIRLGNMLVSNKYGDKPQVHALLALMYFHTSRLDSRTDEDGNLLTLEQQDRSKWDQQLIEIGVWHLNTGSYGTFLSEYHIEASIVAYHCAAPDYASTNWHGILCQYDLLLKIKNTPVVKLNRVVALSKAEGSAKALVDLTELEAEKSLQNYHLFYAVKSELLADQGKTTDAKEALQKAIDLVGNEVEKEYLVEKLGKL